MAGMMAGDAAAELPRDIFAGNTPWHSLQVGLATKEQPMEDQLVAQAAAMAGDEALSCELQPAHAPRPSGAERWVDARDALSAAMVGRRLVMLNETHDRSRQRAFLQQLIPALHSAGFRTMAAETLADDASETVRDGRVRSTSAGAYRRAGVLARIRAWATVARVSS